MQHQNQNASPLLRYTKHGRTEGPCGHNEASVIQQPNTLSKVAGLHMRVRQAHHVFQKYGGKLWVVLRILQGGRRARARAAAWWSMIVLCATVPHLGLGLRRLMSAQGNPTTKMLHVGTSTCLHASAVHSASQDTVTPLHHWQLRGRALQKALLPMVALDAEDMLEYQTSLALAKQHCGCKSIHEGVPARMGESAPDCS